MIKRKEAIDAGKLSGFNAIDDKNRIFVPTSLLKCLFPDNNIDTKEPLFAIVGPEGDCFWLGLRSRIEDRLIDMEKKSDKYLHFAIKHSVECKLSKASEKDMRLTLTKLFNFDLLEKGDRIGPRIELGREDPLLLLFPVKKTRDEIVYVLSQRVNKKLGEDDLAIQW
ncbi:hypothetical protein K9N08_02315 [Candidatus Gracilibacteria bacterium]|nr:hypothetical protein [Candidatus Gracilibacteria bacterium]MCF7856370.1 hypothetical protein [Candidatus Gracilibacteria bacterium]MCF7896834.1 hypothetical protein [Candidatus Gracilibacteria bacterium]